MFIISMTYVAPMSEIEAYLDEHKRYLQEQYDACIFRDDLASDFGMSRPPISVSSGH